LSTLRYPYGNETSKVKVNEQDILTNNMKHLIEVRHFGCPHQHQ